ncbi:hypothetical protein F7725_005016 [Dissostichus mawsoni]|uniref:Uncharacterized protein n=1 Tax=Dissostichus mawsoni TaxID=36200 RepID=A0A7J5XKE8_DISMA|nr:hypothetical protein F7725_005016 [Dissostichus mawsoni]
MELNELLGLNISFISIYLKNHVMFDVGQSLLNYATAGQALFHLLTCVERYLAVVHPLTYLVLRQGGGVRIRNISIGCVWFLSFGYIATWYKDIMHMHTYVTLCFLVFLICVLFFCSISVLYVLKRPGPGEGGGTRERVDQSKQRAFYTIMAILGVLLLRFGANLIIYAMSGSTAPHPSIVCIVSFLSFWFALIYVFSVIDIIYILVLLPFIISVLYVGFQKSKKPRSSSLATSHSDHFTYHSIFMQLNEFMGIALFFTGGFIGLWKMFDLRIALLIALFHLLTCVERYLAVVHPITYLGLRQGGGVRIRNMSIGCVWLFCLGLIPVFYLFHSHIIYICSLFLQHFSSLRSQASRAGGSGGNRKRVDQSKQRAFYTILSITGVILLRFGGNLISSLHQ